MSDGFTNPVVGGTTLVRPSIHSPDYVPGVSGWSINITGDVEFNNGTFRGTITAADIIGALITGGVYQTSATNPRIVIDATDQTITFYNSAGNVDLLLSIDPGAITSYSQQAGNGNIQLSGGILQWLGTNKTYDSFVDNTDDILKFFNNLEGGFGIAAGNLVRLDASGNPSVWQQPGVLGFPVYTANWSGSGTFNGVSGFSLLRFKRTPLNTVKVNGVLLAGATLPSGTVTTVSLDYRPVMRQGLSTSQLAGATLTQGRMRMSTNGALEIVPSLGLAVAINNQYYVNDEYPLD